MPELKGPEWEIGLPALSQAVFEGVGGREISGPFTVLPEN
jgi:hypothetical protein